jgi:hypothetical protein
MDFSKLDQNEKLAVYGAIAVFLAGLISNWGGLLWLALLAAIGVAVVVFLPQFSKGTALPGSKGSLMAGLGLVALGAALIEVLRYLGYIGSTFGSLSTIMFIVAVIGAAVMAYAGWQELQKEGGKWQFGAGGPASSSATAGAASPAAEPPAAPAAPAAEPPPAPAAPPPMEPSAPASDFDDEDRPRDA